MLKYTLPDLSPASMQRLAELQGQVDAIIDATLRYEKASALFGNKNNATFREIRSILEQHAPGGDTCYYCERDRYRDIEHIRPKRHYPQDCFNWHNYVYACAICNQDKKGDKFAVLAANNYLNVFDRHSRKIDEPIPLGIHVLLDLRHEDPLDFLWLDLATGRFEENRDADAIAQIRGQWTCELFDLNNDHAARIRKLAYRSYCEYLAYFQNAADVSKAQLALNEIRKLGNPTVLVEMRRQSDLKPELKALLINVPADIGARP